MTSDQDLTEKARQVLRDNSRTDGKGAHYTVPAKHLYPFQWNWDSAFTALGWHSFDQPRAWREMETLFAHQWDSGKIPHIIFHKDADSYFPGPDLWQSARTPPTSCITQPPVAASIARMMAAQNADKDEAETAIKSLLPKFLKSHRWFHEQRDPQSTGLVAMYHPWESGRDNSAEWDVPLARVPIDDLQPYKRKDTELIDAAERPTNDEYDRFVALVQIFTAHKHDQIGIGAVTPFKVADIGINAILMRANRDLLWLYRHYAPQDEDAISTIENWLAAQEKALPLLWNENTNSFHSLDLLTQQHLPATTSAAYLPFWGTDGTLDQHYAEQLAARLHRWGDEVEYMVPSLAHHNANFEPKRYWRGPVWFVVNYMIAQGLKSAGENELAARIENDIKRLVSIAGFHEYFDPLAGEGGGGDHFSWTAAIWLALQKTG